MQLSVTLVARTQFLHNDASHSIGWQWEKEPGSTDAEALIEFMARSCYRSWDRPNPKTASNADYLAHIEEVGHWSVMEHAMTSFYIQGVSRSLTHELVRHRHHSPSQLSQRFVVLDGDVMVRSKEDFVVPPLFRGVAPAEDILEDLWDQAMGAYERLLVLAEAHLMDKGHNKIKAAKMAREASRAVLPNMTPTAIGLTANHRAWREFLMKRLQPEADAEIQELAREIFRQLSTSERALYQDLEIGPHGGLRVIGTS